MKAKDYPLSMGSETDAFQIDRLALSHGQARWVLRTLGLHAGEDEHTFDAYIKSLRRDRVPFAQGELGVGAGHNITYRYPHLMELAVALALRTQGITISIGLSTLEIKGKSVADVLKRADTALYRAKHDGRNRVVAAAA